MAGTSLKKEVGFILRGDISGNFVIDNTGFIGVGFEGLYLNGKKSKGIINHINNLAMYLVGQLGFFF